MKVNNNNNNNELMMMIMNQNLSASFLVELLLVRCLVEIQVATKNFIRAFSRKNHFYSQRLDFSGHEKHGCAGSNSRHIIRFNMVNHLFQCINSFLINFNNISIQQPTFILFYYTILLSISYLLTHCIFKNLPNYTILLLIFL